ncbi:type VI secretion system baseplate subunit TssE [Xenorhabdus sp. 12]|uniref:Type VI secretion system baseplate subunit TssE n=1 Tax=Xenorhabdus santafensis TaxID=2582833 RepID=A0ABU4SBU5_9GAMM|nr:GPW/gp25 family protein [Xenorhabdus sp. 12]MDX7988230.1 type VI secretion system baseplate subunit TssE [Xenorhabdus sp. 12]
MKDNITLLYGGYHSRKPPRITARDRMQPSLLDKLTDNEPSEIKEPANNYLLSHQKLRKNLLRDLQWLLNTMNREPHQDFSFLPQLVNSVYNFGISPLSGKCISDIEWSDIQNKITHAIQIFEPRIIPDGLQVRCISDICSLSLYNILSIEIKGFLWCIPWPIEFLFRSDIDLENGYITMKQAG